MTLVLRRFLVQPVCANVVDGRDIGEEIGAPFQVWTVEQFAELVAKSEAELEVRNQTIEAEAAAEAEERTAT